MGAIFDVSSYQIKDSFPILNIIRRGERLKVETKLERDITVIGEILELSA